MVAALPLFGAFLAGLGTRRWLQQHITVLFRLQLAGGIGLLSVLAGWRLGRPEAGRALRVYAAEHGHKLFGLTAPPRDERAARGDLPPGTTERIAIGSFTAMLVPRGLELVPAAL